MLTIAPATAEGSWALAEALRRCDSARERLEVARAGLRALDDDMPWRSRAITVLRAQFADREQELREVLSGLCDVEAVLLR
ncbi:hypothetical protein [Microbacterium azadirachtae]|uniref:hypothetical protein n=1 Tax=Microbacterium azadirachtae TaxID=582680 RepID=UPI00088B622A|nr:hypothetical protein [Microbacterium azadirachtae]SDL71991.1 hypothetical protein SAMN04488593_1703 [Microbacterium azadirachtae]SEG01356.1 hypothetical protein SAMN04488594_1690 [Microbacterium azadirachtae]SEG03914.1 hypothetical protein SAMN04488592_1700 [Microbacterium azadirachtae]